MAIRQVGLSEASDNEIVDYAANEDRIVVSHDTAATRYALADWFSWSFDWLLAGCSMPVRARLPAPCLWGSRPTSRHLT